MSRLYIVGESGYGWFLLALLVAMPFFAVAASILVVSEWVIEHLVLAIFIWLFVSLMIGIIASFVSINSHRIAGAISRVLFLLPLGVTEFIDAIPNVIYDSPSMLDVLVNWIAQTLMFLAVTVIVWVLCDVLSDNGLVHFGISLAFVAIMIIPIHYFFTEANCNTVADVLRLYGFA